VPEDAPNFNAAAVAAWLKNGEAYVATVQTIIRGLWAFVAAMIVTLVIQHRQLNGYQRELKATQIGDLPEWVTLRAAYEEIPPTYLSEKLGPWYRLLEQSVMLSTFMTADKSALAKDRSPASDKIVALIDQSGADIPSATAVDQIGKAFRSLRDYNSNVRAVVWPMNAGVEFDDLSLDELAAMVSAYSYVLDPDLAPGEKATKDLSAVFVNRHLDAVKNAAGEPLFTPPFPENMQAGMGLANLTPLFGDLAVLDLQKFGSNPIPASRAKEMLAQLKTTTFTSIKDAKQRGRDLQHKIDAIQSGDASSPVKIPLIDLELSLADFGYLSSALNAALMVWILWSLKCLRTCLTNARRSDAANDPDVATAMLFNLPGGKAWPKAFLFLFALFLSLPSILGTVVLQSELHRSSAATLAFILPAVFVFALAVRTAAYCSKVKAEGLMT
jgi:hypothetical protein